MVLLFVFENGNFYQFTETPSRMLSLNTPSAQSEQTTSPYCWPSKSIYSDILTWFVLFFFFFILALFFLHMTQLKPCKNDKNEQFPKHQTEANTEHNDGCASENISLLTGCLAGKL